MEGPPEAVPARAQLGNAVKWLQQARHACVDAPPAIGKAAEWLLDNDYQVHRAIRQVQRDLPAAFLRRLPRLAGPTGYPRVFALAHDYLATTRLQVSKTSGATFLETFQNCEALTIGEIWAFPAMLRLACLEICVAALTDLLDGRVEAPFPVSQWALDLHSLDNSERVARAIANLGLISTIPWDDFFDEVSLVERRLADDPSGFYPQMDFESRDRYRGAVERIAFLSGRSELDVASEVVERCKGIQARQIEAHVGHWLVAGGLGKLEQSLGIDPALVERAHRWVLSNPGTSYATALFICAAGALLLPSLYLFHVGAGLAGWLGGLAATFIPATILAVTVVHWAITHVLPPRVLHKLDCSNGIPEDSATAVAVPVMIGRESEIEPLIEQLEIHWMANRDPRLAVVLLADLADSPQAEMPGDSSLIDRLETGVERLNERHRQGSGGPFHLLMRPRLLNLSERKWVAWERKRGKLEQFNKLLIEGDESPFTVRVGSLGGLANVRFVVTVDADTMLPPGSVAKLVGTLAHPLNQARFDPASGAMTGGYTIVQPRTEISPFSGTRTWFTRLFTGDTAIDIYSRAVSDVYQDLFGAGIFVGKGIYDVSAFHRTVDGRVPDNRILSHDLFEGAHGRVALATDIVLYEGFPANYLEYAGRLHRWVRGDWQLIPWLGRTVPAPGGGRLPTSFSGIDRWKILDNLRRSLIAPSILLLLLAGWTVLPGSPWFWTLLAVLAPAGQLFADLVSGLAAGRRRGVMRGRLTGLSDQAGRWFLAIVYLLHEAMLALDAILVTSWRVAISRRHLLQWTTAAQLAARSGSRGGRLGIWREMWAGPAAAALIMLLVAQANPGSLPSALPLLLLWIAVPEITWQIGRARATGVRPLSADDQLFLRAVARQTWFFFEKLVGPEDNWLPPDNYQGPPHEEVAHRTSPTNIGMMLLSCATAWDLGYLGRAELAARAEALFDSLERLDQHRGHLFNWYDTQTLEPLEPRYVSTVDSGNLAASLVVFAVTLREAAATRGLERQRWDGLLDVARLLVESTLRLPEGSRNVPTLQGLIRHIEQVRADPDLWQSSLDDIVSTRVPAVEEELAASLETASVVDAATVRTAHDWAERLQHQAKRMSQDLAVGGGIEGQLRALSERSANLADAMDFAPLYDRERRLFFIGLNISAGRTDPHHYDLLASEARLASFFAIAKGDVPIDHWFHLGRPVTKAGRAFSLLSWNGSMFEYLMPRLLLKSGPETLLGESETAAVRVQRRYGDSRDVPWGISESAFAARDPDHRFRYQAFGVPGLGLRRGLDQDMVVAPYAAALAIAVDPGEAASNLGGLARLGAIDRFGFMEALDFTPERRPPGTPFTPVNAHMAHHQGMILAAIGNALRGDPAVRRFAEDPRIRLISLLLSERVPKEAPPEIDRLEERSQAGTSVPAARLPPPWKPRRSAAFPQAHLLGNGRMSSWLSLAGGGGLKWRGHALTRFSGDPTLDREGLWIFIADEDNGQLWSATLQPTGIEAEENVTCRAHLVEIHRRFNGIASRLEIGIGGSDDVEVRRIVLANEGNIARRLRLTSYGEPVLAPPLDDERHPAFSKLFIGSAWVDRPGGLLFTRRPKSPKETPPVLLHFLVGPDGPVTDARFETDRASFIGRGRTPRRPLGAIAPLGNRTGFRLDPAMAIQHVVELEAFEAKEFCFVTVAAASRHAATEIAERHATSASVDWLYSDSVAMTGRTLERARVDPASMPALQALSSHLVYPCGPLRGAVGHRQNRLGQDHLWGLAISGDLPILLLKVAGGGSDQLPELVAFHQYWRSCGLECDLVVMQSGGSAYNEPLRDDLAGLLREIDAFDTLGRRGGVHLLFSDQIGADLVQLLEASAWAVLDDGSGSTIDQLEAAISRHDDLPLFTPSRPVAEEQQAGDEETSTDLDLDNGFGGFAPLGNDYVIRLPPDQSTPAPWANVLANDRFGTLVTESGGGFTWAINSGEHRLTPWTNDPVSDRPVETVYLRDEETGEVWSVTPRPAGPGAQCEIRHGAGYSSWTRRSHGLEQELLQFVPPDAPVKLFRLRLRNRLDRHRRITSTCYCEWLLGAIQSIARHHVQCSLDPATNALLARNCWNPDFADRVAFLAASREPHGFTTDRREFLGLHGDQARPMGLRRWGLSGRVVSGDDCCAAYQVHHDIGPGETSELWFVLGEGEDEAEAAALARRWSNDETARRALETVRADWDELLARVEVRTPDMAFDHMINRWLIYQARSSRILARTGFYQSSGAFGFRDQLQDVLALLHFEPGRARAHILECARHQFEEGDVLHWWHPPADRGVRTRCSDDMLWLVYATSTYVEFTGDRSILEEEVRFLTAPSLGPHEEDRYARFETSSFTRPLIEHCERALNRALTQGRNGLPLIGTGDWNDGMDRIGRGGEGESVWLGWFVSVCCDRMADMDRLLGRPGTGWNERAEELRRRIEDTSWDGAWYRRAYYDDGQPVGSSENRECRIDSISQSWAVFAGGRSDRVETALDSAAAELLDPDSRLARLLWPPFDAGPRDPGYIKAYPPGIRENGGQYSHAAAWLGMAFAALGRGEEAMRVFAMLNPISRSTDRESAITYAVEPYVVAGDIASASNRAGRGGWTWYSGAAAWTWRLGVESILGLQRRAGKLIVKPCIPPDWGGFEAHLRGKLGTIALTVEDPHHIGHGEVRLIVDGKPSRSLAVAFPGAGKERTVIARIRRAH